QNALCYLWCLLFKISSSGDASPRQQNKQREPAERIGRITQRSLLPLLAPVQTLQGWCRASVFKLVDDEVTDIRDDFTSRAIDLRVSSQTPVHDLSRSQSAAAVL